MKLYEYAVIFVPMNSDGDVIKDECKIVVEPTVVLAADERTANLKAAREIPEDLDLDFVQVVVRPF